MDVLPGDNFTINTHARIESLPMIAPVMGRWKASFDYYFEPFSNLYGFMDNNKRLDTQAIINMARHTIRLGANINAQTGLDETEVELYLKRWSSSGRGSLNEYMGVPIGYLGKVYANGPGFTNEPTEHPLERWIAYVDIVRNYYVNNQEGDAYYTNYDPLNEGRGHTTLLPYSSIDMDNLLMDLRYLNSPLQIWAQDDAFDFDRPSFNALGAWLHTSCKPSSGLFVRTYRMDLLRGIMNSNVGTYRSVVSTSGDNFTIETLRFANKLQTLIDRIDITGGRFSDWIRTRWSANVSKEVDRPVYLGSHSSWIDTTDVVATASGSSGSESDTNMSPNSVLGQQAGFAIGNIESKRAIHLNSNEYGILMCCFSLTPDVVYSQGFELDMLKTKFADIYDPAFKQLGYQDVSKYEMFAKPLVISRLVGNETRYVLTSQDPNMSVGKRIAWSEYMASLPRSYGHYAYGEDMDYWVNNRNYLSTMTSTPIFSASSYINPTDWNNIFADQSLVSENFRLKVMFEVDAWRPIGKRVMPHL